MGTQGRRLPTAAALRWTLRAPLRLLQVSPLAHAGSARCPLAQAPPVLHLQATVPLLTVPACGRPRDAAAAAGQTVLLAALPGGPVLAKHISLAAAHQAAAVQALQ